MRVGVAAEQQRLEEHHRHRPDRRRAAEPRQHHLGEQRLHGKQQQSAREDRGGVDDQQQAMAGNGQRNHESSGLDSAGAEASISGHTPGGGMEHRIPCRAIRHEAEPGGAIPALVPTGVFDNDGWMTHNEVSDG
jgi:hypothetical protein